MILDAAETVLGFDRTARGNGSFKKNRKWRWYEELRQQRIRDIEAERV
jgi:hypothetical protein